MTSEKLWKPINNFEEFYMVSNQGEIKRLNRITDDGKRLKERLLKLIVDKDGYFMIGLYKNKKRFPKKVHRLVAEAFIPNPNNLPCVNHIDGNKQNNNVENLEWCTFSENLKHAYKIGLAHGIPAMKRPHKLTWEIVKDIRKHCVPGDLKVGYHAFGRKYKISYSTVKAIFLNQKWKDPNYVRKTI